ncbi:MAG: phasin family protein [Gammaproteobacteria bacterium]
MAKRNGSSALVDNQLTRLVRGSANQVWQVGRGAYSLAGNGGSRLVGDLMSIGGRLDHGPKSRVFEARSFATEAWDRLENAFVHRVGRALNALQIPTARDVRELTQRVEMLQKAVVALERRAAEVAATGATTGATTGASPAARKVGVRKAGARKKTAARPAQKVPSAARKKAGG